MALLALVGKLRVLPERAAASHAFSSQLEKQCPKCSREVQAGSFAEMMKERKRRDMEEIARLKRNNTAGMVLGTAGVSARSVLLKPYLMMKCREGEQIKAANTACQAVS